MAEPILRARCASCPFALNYRHLGRYFDLRFEQRVDAREQKTGHQVDTWESHIGRPTTEQFIRRHGHRWRAQEYA